MGSEEGWNSSDVSASPAGLVWVRRRNGSWWPGRIVRPEELPQKLLSKSGTPIKLLGREDGSMDWYNLEKSKRVKPFRCGEYDEFIEKAKISAVRPNRIIYSTGKYVRREDAILHALELEKAYFSMGKHSSSQKNNYLTTKGNSLANHFKRKHERESSGKPGCRARKQRFIEENSMQELSQSVVSFENKPATDNKRYMQHKRWKTPNDSEDDEGMKRMRDLQEIELGMGSNRKPNRHLQKLHELALPDSNTPAESNLDTSFFNIGQLKSKYSSSLKKQSQVIQEHENVKKKDRRRQLTKVCGGSRVIIPSYCHWDGSCGTHSSGQGISENYPGALVSTTRRSDVSDTTSPDTSETSSDEALLDACETTALVGNTGLDSEIKDSEHSSMLGYTDNDCTNGLVNIPLVLGDHIGEDYLSINKHYSSRKLPPHAVKLQNICSKGNLLSCFPEGLGESSFTGSGRHENHARQKKQKTNLEQHSNGKTLSAVDAPSLSRKSQQPFPRRRDSNPSYLKHKVSCQFENMELDFPLYDVELTVQTSYHGPHVPLVSLMSRLNGKAIVGHPVSVEVSEDGATDAIVQSNDSWPVKNKLHKSSRNSAAKIGRWSPRKGRAHLKYSSIRAGCSLKKKCSNNKNPRLSPRKIRKLSSISIDRKGKEDKKLVVQKIGGPVVACVPLRLVFSRITEALSCCPRAGSIS